MIIEYLMIPAAHAAIGLPVFSGGFGDFIRQIYNFAIAMVGIAVFIQFLRAGLSYLYAAGNAGETMHAKEMMQNAIMGAILLLSAYLILNVINPDLTNVSLFSLPSVSPSATTTTIVKSDTCFPKDWFGSMQDNGESEVVNLEYHTVAGAQITWSAPGGSPDHGTGPSFHTKYSNAGNYTVSITSVNGTEPPINNTCSVTVKPYVPPTNEDTVARAKFTQVGIQVDNGFSLQGINNATVTQLIVAKNRCDLYNGSPCTIRITNFQNQTLGDVLSLNISPSGAWIKWMNECCTLGSGDDWTDSSTGIHYLKLNEHTWHMAIPN